MIPLKKEKRIDYLFQRLVTYVGEGILSDWAEEQIIMIEEQFRDETAPPLSPRQINFLEQQLRYGNAHK